MHPAQHRAEAALVPKIPPRSQGMCLSSRKAKPAHTALPAHPAVPAPSLRFLCRAQLPGFGQPQVQAGRSCWHCPARCPAGPRRERAVPVLGQLDLSDLLQVALMMITHYYPLKPGKYMVQESLGPGGDAGKSHSKG